MNHKLDKIKELIGEPQEDVDYHKKTLEFFTVSIEVDVTGYLESDEDICYKAVEAVRNRKVDCNPRVVFSEKIKDVKLDWITDLPFDENAWQQRKLAELGLNENGDVLRPWEKDMPESQKRLVIA